MTLDKEDHRTILLQLMNKSHFPGEFSEEVTVLKRAIANAAHRRECR